MKAVIFDLDGVLVTTDDYHYAAWKKLADDENIYFDRAINERLRGVSRMESLNIVLERAEKTYAEAQKGEMAARKNEYYVQSIRLLDRRAVLPGAEQFVKELRKRGIKTAVGSSSKNTGTILNNTGLTGLFDAVTDGNDIKNSKPDPEVFLLAAARLGVEPACCLVVEDANAGVSAGVAAGMKVLAVGSAKDNPAAAFSAEGLGSVSVSDVLR